MGWYFLHVGGNALPYLCLLTEALFLLIIDRKELELYWFTLNLVGDHVEVDSGIQSCTETE